MYLRDDLEITFTLGEGKKKCAIACIKRRIIKVFEDETRGVKVKPEVILGVTGALIGISIIIRIVFQYSILLIALIDE